MRWSTMSAASTTLPLAGAAAPVHADEGALVAVNAAVLAVVLLVEFYLGNLVGRRFFDAATDWLREGRPASRAVLANASAPRRRVLILTSPAWAESCSPLVASLQRCAVNGANRLRPGSNSA